MRGRSTLLALAVFLSVGAVLSACGDREPVDHPAAPQGGAVDNGGESWWLLQAPGYEPVSGGQTPEEISNTTGNLWMLEYSNGPQNIRLVADRAGGLFSQLSQASPEVGTVMLEGGIEATLRQHPGRPEEGIAPSIGAEWTDNDVFVSFGGPGLSEPALRGLLTQVRRVTREEWQEATAAVPAPSTEGPAAPLPSAGP